MKCTTYNRCIRCREINYKRALKHYISRKRELLGDDPYVNITIAVFLVNDLLKMRAKLGKMARAIENYKRKMKKDEMIMLSLKKGMDYLEKLKHSSIKI